MSTHLPLKQPRIAKWVARCPVCPYEIDLESLGWVPVGAYSWGKRRSIMCPDCGCRRFMRIVHVDAKGNPDQPFGLVLRKTLKLQLVIWGVVLSSLFSLGLILLTVLAFLGFFTRS